MHHTVELINYFQISFSKKFLNKLLNKIYCFLRYKSGWEGTFCQFQTVYHSNFSFKSSSYCIQARVVFLGFPFLRDVRGKRWVETPSKTFIIFSKNEYLNIILMYVNINILSEILFIYALYVKLLGIKIRGQKYYSFSHW